MRLLIVLGLGVVVMAAGQGCQMSDGHCGPMNGGMMGGGMGPLHGTAPDASEAKPVDDSSLDDETTQWLQGARGFDGGADRTGGSDERRDRQCPACHWLAGGHRVELRHRFGL